MAKQSGVGSALWVGSSDISGDVGAVNSITTSRGVLDVTGIDKAAPERVLGLRDGEVSFTAFWNVATGAAHDVLSAMPRTDVQTTVAVGAQSVGSAAASFIAKQTGYAPARGQDGSLVATVTAAGNAYPLEWGRLLTTGKQTFSDGDVDGTSVDHGAATAYGAAAYLHVFSLGSGDPTITVTDSANNVDFAALGPTSLVFTPTAAGVERKQTGVTAAVRRYLRVEVTGTYTDLVCALVVVRYTADPS